MRKKEFGCMGNFGDFTGRSYMTIQVKGLQSIHPTAHQVFIHVTGAAVTAAVLMPLYQEKKEIVIKITGTVTIPHFEKFFFLVI